MNKITVYSKPNCHSCEFAKKYLDNKGVPFEEIDVFQDAEALAMLRDEGFSQMPVVSMDGEFHTGFQPNLLAKAVK